MTRTLSCGPSTEVNILNSFSNFVTIMDVCFVAGSIYNSLCRNMSCDHSDSPFVTWSVTNSTP